MSSIFPPELPQVTADFLQQHGWGQTEPVFLAGDFSARRYYRLQKANATASANATAVLMHAPPPEVLEHFLAVGDILRQMQASVPQIYALDKAHGLLLQEDFGDITLAKHFAHTQNWHDVLPQGLSVLQALQATALPAAAQHLPRFDVARFTEQVMLFATDALPDLMGRSLLPTEEAALRTAWQQVLVPVCAGAQAILLRDYHLENLMLLSGRAGWHNIGILDFQDAGIGPYAYDVVSLLEDARRDIPTDIAQKFKQDFAAHLPKAEREIFLAGYDVLGAQRHCRIIAIILRVARLMNKTHNLRFLPRVWGQLNHKLTMPALAPVRLVLDELLPPQRRQLLAA